MLVVQRWNILFLFFFLSSAKLFRGQRFPAFYRSGNFPPTQWHIIHSSYISGCVGLNICAFGKRCNCFSPKSLSSHFECYPLQFLGRNFRRFSRRSRFTRPLNTREFLPVHFSM